jgi:flagellar biosynthetic protein FliP
MNKNEHSPPISLSDVWDQNLSADECVAGAPAQDLQAGQSVKPALWDVRERDMSFGKRAVRMFTPLRTAMLIMSILILGLFALLSAQNIPSVTLSLANTNNPAEVSTALQVLFLITVLALAPSILIMMTSFIRIIIVLSFLRRALGTQTLPPDQIMVGLALFMTLFVMMPVLTEINQNALQPYLAEEIQFREAVDVAIKPVRNFMLRQVSEKDVALFVRISRMPPPRTVDDLPLEVIIPAFITSELKTGFIIGFILFIPFLVIDMVVASVLLSMGMMMLPPTMIAMPFKIILFVMVDGWHLIVRQLVVSFR